MLRSKKSITSSFNRRVTYYNKKQGVEYAFESEELTNLLKGETEKESLNYTVKSKNRKESITFKSQQEWVIEFLKILGLAHECMPEVASQPDGSKMIFYQGPSPDEVTLVDFAKLQGLEFLETSDSHVKLRFYKFWEPSKEVTYDVYRRMEFNSDRKRMSILFRDPQDNKVKLYTKGADSIIKERLDTQQID